MTVLEYDERPGLSVLFARQSRAASQNGSPLYADLCRAASLDLAREGMLTALLASWSDARAGDMLPLRVLGAAHRLVLEREAPRLALYYPSVGGTAPTDAAGRGECYSAWVDALLRAVDRLPDLLTRPPQTNDPGRAASLAGVLRTVADAWQLPIRLHELGASGGLNLRADRVRVEWDGGAVGPASSPLVLEDSWLGAPLPVGGVDPIVVERIGCDLDPVDVGSPDGRLHLTSFIWPDQVLRLRRLRAAFDLAASVPATLLRADLVDHLLALQPQEGTALVVWHSSTWMYLRAPERDAARAAIESLGSAATPAAPVVHVAREFLGDRLETGFAVVTQWWPASPEQLASGLVAGAMIQVADTPAHGLPVTWMTAHEIAVDDV